MLPDAETKADAKSAVIDVSDDAVRERAATPPQKDDPGDERPLLGKVAVVTGASGGIGKAVALALGAAGAKVAILGAEVDELRATVAEAGEDENLLYLKCDIGKVSDIEVAADFITRMDRPLDILVHAAGVLEKRGTGVGHVVDLDEQYLINLRGPYVLTQRLMPQLISDAGQVVFINSTDTRTSFGGPAQHAIVKQGLTALADSLRKEVSPRGVRVTSIFPGKTATPITERVHLDRGVTYDPMILLQAGDIAESVLAVVTLPSRVEVTDVVLQPSTRVPAQ